MTESERFAKELQILASASPNTPRWKQIVVERARQTEIALGYERPSTPPAVSSSNKQAVSRP